MKARGLRVKTGAVFEPPQPEWLVATDPAYLTDSDGKFLVSGIVYGSGSGACTITLTGDIAATVGGDPLDISGQTVSKTVAASPTENDYAAGGPTVSLWPSGWRAIGYQATTFTATDDVTLYTSQRFYILSSDFTELAEVFYSQDGPPGTPACWSISTNAGLQVLGGETDPFAKVAIAVDGATGDVVVVIGGTLYTKSTLAILSGVFTKPVLPAVFFTHLGDPTTYEATVTTDAAGLASFALPAGTLDWCGNPLS